MKRVLIIGKTSYIGRSWKDYMEKNHGDLPLQIDCVGAVNEEWKTANLKEYEVVVHMAALVHQKEEKAGEDAYRRVNYELPMEIAKGAKASGVGQFVFLSTMAVYGNVSGKITKETKAQPETYYGIYKYKAEEELRALHTDKFRITIIRPPMVYGKDCKGNFKRLVKLAGISMAFPEISNKRSMLYIENLCEYLYLVLERQAYGIGCPQNPMPVETTDLFCKIRKAQNRKTMTTKAFNPLLIPLMKRIKSLDKMFGDCYYELENAEGSEDFWIDIPPREYEKVKFEESVWRSV
ncbi:MAG: NAD-dependent epimerase/dehydratase family protein [Acetivibrio sp.]